MQVKGKQGVMGIRASLVTDSTHYIPFDRILKTDTIDSIRPIVGVFHL